jgi:hypothetical protein
MNRRGDQEAVGAWARAVLEPAPGTPANAASNPAPDRPGDGSEVGQRVYRELWAGLELPPEVGAPPGFASRVARAYRRERESAAPILGALWMRAAAAAALLAGAVLGGALSGVGEAGEAELPGDAQVIAAAEIDAWEESSLSEEYLAALGAAESAPAAGSGTGAGTTAP